MHSKFWLQNLKIWDYSEDLDIIGRIILEWILEKLTPCNRVLLEKLIFTKLVKKFPTMFGTRRFFTVFTRACHCSLSWARWIHSTPSHPTSLRPDLIFTAYLRPGFRSGVFPPGFSTNILYTFLISPIACYMSHPSHLPWHDRSNNIWWCALRYAVFFSLPDLLQIFSSAPCFQTLSTYVIPLDNGQYYSQLF
jgi:hypothetical protein